jgi:hypothetical protein
MESFHFFNAHWDDESSTLQKDSRRTLPLAEGEGEESQPTAIGLQTYNGSWKDSRDRFKAP